MPVEDIDRANIAFISLDEDWLSADCYQIPVHTRRRHRVVICNRNDKDKLMFRSCLYMSPLIYREDDVEETTKKLVLILQKRALRNNVLATICHYCTTRNFSIEECQFLMLFISGYTLVEIARLFSVNEIQTKATRRSIMKKLHMKNDQQFLRYIRACLNFLQNQVALLCLTFYWEKSHHQLSTGTYCTYLRAARTILAYYFRGNRKTCPVIFYLIPQKG